MRKLIVVLLSLSLLVSSDLFARTSSRSGGSSFRSSPRSAPSKPSPKPAPTKPSQPSTIKPAQTTTTTTQKPKAVSTNAIDKKQQKMLVSKDAEAFKKYPTKAAAENDYKQSLAKQSTYTSSIPPTQKPSYIPENITSNGRPVNVTYNVYPDGRYGYGYVDPTTMLFVALASDHYRVDSYEMRNAGYGQWDNTGKPIVVHHRSYGLIIFFTILGIIVIVFVIVKMI